MATTNVDLRDGIQYENPVYNSPYRFVRWIKNEIKVRSGLDSASSAGFVDGCVVEDTDDKKHFIQVGPNRPGRVRQGTVVVFRHMQIGPTENGRIYSFNGIFKATPMEVLMMRKKKGR